MSDMPATGAPPALTVSREPFGQSPTGETVWCYRMSNRQRMSVDILTYGARIHAIRVPDKDGVVEDITLGFDDIQGYAGEHDAYFGAIIGRYANRIGGGAFTLDGQRHEISTNEGAHTLHGGQQGFSARHWAAESYDAGNSVGVELTYFSADDEMGFPGNLAVTVRYSLDDSNRLRIDYSAVCDRATPVNLTNHVYFNLAGAGMPSVLEHVAMINAARYTPVDEALIPIGELAPVAQTPLDFTRPRRIGAAIDADHEQLVYGNGYDHNWALDTAGDIGRLAVRVIEPESGRGLEMFTTEPGVQFYTGNGLAGDFTGKQNARYAQRSAFALEAQHYPDSPNRPDFPDTVLRPGQKYSQSTIYRFLPDLPQAAGFLDGP